jgi:hypothetical protein
MNKLIILLCLFSYQAFAGEICAVERKIFLGKGQTYCSIYCAEELSFLCLAKKNGYCKTLKKCLNEAKVKGLNVKKYSESKDRKK